MLRQKRLPLPALPLLHCGPVFVGLLKLPRHGFDGDRPIACQPSDPTQLGPDSSVVCFGMPIPGVWVDAVLRVPVPTTQCLAPEVEAD